MPYATDERLKCYLDTNQLARERMCLAIVELDRRFSQVRPRQPRGGPDGGRDIDAVFQGIHRTFGAVGFVNQADDSTEKKRRASDKFKSDLASALSAIPIPQAFVFLTNVNFTVGEKDDLASEARVAGLSFCEIFDRERLRMVLDSADGFAIRYQYLKISLSEPEQAAFFARWGADIQSMISLGFQDMHRSLNRLLFLQESTDALSELRVLVELDRVYSAEEIGHYRAFCEFYLKEPKHGVTSILFGSFDGFNRLNNESAAQAAPSTLVGISDGISGGQWEWTPDLMEAADPEEGRRNAKGEIIKRYHASGRSTSIGKNAARFVEVEYTKRSIVRRSPTLSLYDFNECSFILRVNRRLAEMVARIHVYANSYKLLEVPKPDFSFDDKLLPTQCPVDFSDSELSDSWVYIRPNDSTMFMIRFSEQTPHRFYSPRETVDSLRNPLRQ